MRRRDFIAGAGAIGVLPVAVGEVWAQGSSAARRPVIGYLGTSAVADGTQTLFATFVDAMGRLGYADSRNIEIVRRSDDFHGDRYPSLARELLSLGTDVILAETPPGAVAAHEATSRVPIVCPTLNEPVQLGLIESFAKPNSNVTGISTRVEGMSQKRLGILHAISPEAKTIGLLMTNAVSGVAQRQDIETAANAAHLALVVASIEQADDLPPALADLKTKGAQALIFTQDSLIAALRARLIAAAAQARLPAMYGFPDDVEAGGLVSYGTDINANFRRAAAFVEKILKGAKPGDLPVEFPTKVILAINLKTAKALGLRFPEALLATADQVIE